VEGGFSYVSGAGPGIEEAKKVAVDAEKLLQVVSGDFQPGLWILGELLGLLLQKSCSSELHSPPFQLRLAKVSYSVPPCRPLPPLQIDHLSTLSDDPAPAVTRIVYTENDVAARK